MNINGMMSKHGFTELVSAEVQAPYNLWIKRGEFERIIIILNDNADELLRALVTPLKAEMGNYTPLSERLASIKQDDTVYCQAFIAFYTACLQARAELGVKSNASEVGE